METQIIKAPSAELRVTDLKGKRQIMINGKAVHHGRLVKFLDSIETPLSVSTIKKLVALKGDWWLDELERRQDKNYMRRRLETLIKRFDTFNGKKVLDIGSGSGSSALVMLDNCALEVHGVEPNKAFVELANDRAKDEGQTERTFFTQVQDTSKLEFADNKFDIVTFNAVLEHIPPNLRQAIIKEAYRCLKPGGFMIFTETPNRTFPYDGHTTGLPLIPWLPLSMSYKLAKTFSRHVPRGLSKERYINEGLVGGSYWQIKKAIPEAKCLNTDGGDADWKSDLKKANPLVRWWLMLVEWKMRIFFKLPLNAFMPMLDLVFKKPIK